MKTSYEIIEEKVVSAVPEIMELKFGCEVLIFGAKKRKVWDVSEEDMVKMISVERYHNQRFFPDEYEILGRPIRLADVLVVIEKAGHPNVNITSYGEFLRWNGDTYPDATVKALGVNWNLRKDDLREQSEETLEFLANLLK